MPTTPIKSKGGRDILLTWDEEDVRHLPKSVLKILEVFVSSNKLVLSTEAISKQLKGKLKGKQLGASLAAFSKHKDKDLLVSFLMKVGQGNTLWEINERQLPVIKKALEKVRAYLV